MLINRQRGRESGQTLVVAALVMAVVMGFTALAIDVGLFLEERRDNQNDADAMALAGVQYLPESPDMAMKVAKDWGLKNGVASTEIVKIQVQSTKATNDSVYVELRTKFSWIFGRVLGQTTSPVPAKAKAMVGVLSGNDQMMPWAMVLGESACLDSAGNPIFGITCAVKVGADSSQITGWYGALDYDGTGGGSAEYEQNIVDNTVAWKYCIAGDQSAGCVTSVPAINTLDGNKVGGTDQGIDTRLSEAPCDTNGNDVDDFLEVFKPNTTGGGADYTVICESPRLVIIPIVTYSSVPIHEVTIRGWSLGYLEGYQCVGGTGNSNNCQAQGHWEVQITMVDAVYSQSSGFITAYQAGAPIKIRRLIE